MTSRLPRRLGGALLAALLATAGLVALIHLFSSRDSSSLSAVAGPGQLLADGGDRHLPRGSSDPLYATDPPASGAHVVVAVTRDDVALDDDRLLTALEQGNVVLVYGAISQRFQLGKIASAISGPFAASIAAAGQAVILDPLPSVPAGPVLALAWRRELRAAGPSDPRLAAFAGYWLGRGAGAG